MCISDRFNSVRDRIKNVGLELAREMLKQKGSMKLQLVLNSATWRIYSENGRYINENGTGMTQTRINMRTKAEAVSMNNAENFAEDQLSHY